MSYLKKIVQSQFTLKKYQTYKLISKLSPPVINSILKLNSDSRCNLRQISQFFISFVRSVYHGAGSIPYLSLKICDILPDDNKTKKKLGYF